MLGVLLERRSRLFDLLAFFSLDESTFGEGVDGGSVGEGRGGRG